MKSTRSIGTALAVALGLLGGSLAPAPAAEKVTMIALVTSSTQTPFDELVKVFEKKHPGVTIETKFLGGGQIASEVDKGTPADIVIAGATPLKKVLGSLEAPTEIYQTKDVIIAKKKNKTIKELKDLGTPGVKVAMATPGSAVGAVASQVVQKYAAGENDFGFVKRVLDNVAKPQPDKESDVVAAVEKDSRQPGGADAAIVFVTSATDTVNFNVIDIPDKYNVISTYVASVAKSAKNAALGREFVALLASKEGQAVFHKHHYLPPK
ncbi:MAG: extracellular solute-binding protein [Candidatus Eremiobacteraeota bacterium]|nr:extracellular solute-binding protein [Candidatus Eremiobacteraeota bacterium]